eukprot:3116685-Heterocapsa_arctica.AAC.1
MFGKGHSGFNKDEYDINNSDTLHYWKEMNAHPNFKDWDTPEKIDKLCAYMANQPKEDIDDLSRMGA